MANSVLELTPRLQRKIAKREFKQELSNYYNGVDHKLPLKELMKIQALQKYSSNHKQDNLRPQTFDDIEYKFGVYDKLINHKNISDLLYYISRYYNLFISEYQQRQFDLKKSCDRGENYRIIDCSCNHRHFIKTSCNSFFCEVCRKYNTSKVKRKAKEYLMNCNHFYAVFTLPSEIQNKVEKWDKFFDKRNYKDKNGIVRTSEIYYTDLVYKSVSDSIKEYCKKHRIENGFVLMPHSYGSLKLNWNFHINALISSKGYIKKYDLKDFSKNNPIFDNSQEYSDFMRILHRIKGLKYCVMNIRKIRKYFLVNYGEKLNTTTLEDYQFNYNELRIIYKKHLLKNFKIPFKYKPQVRFAKKKGTIYVSYKRSIKKLMDYFRHIPIGQRNIIKIEAEQICYRTSKGKQQNIFFNCSLVDFFSRIMQHIPPQNFRTIRQYGLYSNKTTKRKKYPLGSNKLLKTMSCDKCKKTLKRENYIGMVHNGVLVWINNSKGSIFNYRDFVDKNNIELESNGRVMCACEPPMEFKPKTKPEFPENDEKDISETTGGLK